MAYEEPKFITPDSPEVSKAVDIAASKNKRATKEQIMQKIAKDRHRERLVPPPVKHVEVFDEEAILNQVNEIQSKMGDDVMVSKAVGYSDKEITELTGRRSRILVDPVKYYSKEVIDQINTEDPLTQLATEPALAYEMFLSWFARSTAHRTDNDYCKNMGISRTMLVRLRKAYAWEMRDELCRRKILDNMKKDVSVFQENVLKEQKSLREKLISTAVNVATANLARYIKEMRDDPNKKIKMSDLVQLMKLGIQEQREETLDEYKPIKKPLGNVNFNQTNTVVNNNQTLNADLSGLD